MKTTRIICVLLLCAVMCAVLASCGDANSIVGVWEGTYTYNGNDFHLVLTLNQDGSYQEVSYKNGSLSRTTNCIWEAEGNSIKCYDDEEKSSWAEYELKNGKLYNGDNIVLSKVQ